MKSTLNAPKRTEKTACEKTRIPRDKLPRKRYDFLIELNSSFSYQRIRTQSSFDAYKIGTTVHNAPLFNAFENDCCFSGGLNRGFKNVKNGYYWQQHSPLMKWTGIKLWETVQPPLS